MGIPETFPLRQVEEGRFVVGEDHGQGHLGCCHSSAKCGLLGLHAGV